MPRLLTFYGDDITGSTDVMEALANHGVETVLFTRMPTAQEFAPFSNHRAVGLAGTSRSQTPQWMDKHLPPIFTWLKSLDGRFCHYKVCSTFDSSPQVGNIGRATEIGAAIFSQEMVPMVVGAPELKRFTFAGNLFAGYQGEVFRIDRHPVMSRHPVTPMHEADLRAHLAPQTKMQAILANKTWPEAGIGLADVYDSETQTAAGRRLLDWNGGFVVGSSGIEYALVKALAERGIISGSSIFAPIDRVEQVVVISGSVSPTTERQIKHALQNGFVPIPVDSLALAQQRAPIVAEVLEAALAAIGAGKSPLVHTALGPSSDEGAKLNEIPDGRKHVGEGLGIILKSILDKTRMRRAIIAGGDSSSHALGQLDIYALTTRMPLPVTPGSPMCLAFSSNDRLNGIELALKGGQVGGEDYFVALRDGRT